MSAKPESHINGTGSEVLLPAGMLLSHHDTQTPVDGVVANLFTEKTPPKPHSWISQQVQMIPSVMIFKLRVNHDLMFSTALKDSSQEGSRLSEV